MNMKVLWIALAAIVATNSAAVALDDTAGREVSPKVHEQMTSQSHMHAYTLI
jgi:hypothetical protein